MPCVSAFEARPSLTDVLPVLLIAHRLTVKLLLKLQMLRCHDIVPALS